MQATTHMEGEPVKREYISSTSKHGQKRFPASASGLSNRRIHAITGCARHHTSHKVNHRSGSSSFSSSSRMTKMLERRGGGMLFVCPRAKPLREERKKKKIGDTQTWFVELATCDVQWQPAACSATVGLRIGEGGVRLKCLASHWTAVFPANKKQSREPRVDRV